MVTRLTYEMAIVASISQVMTVILVLLMRKKAQENLEQLCESVKATNLETYVWVNFGLIVSKAAKSYVRG